MPELKSLVYKQNEFGMKTMEYLRPFMVRPMPNQMDELRIINCKMGLGAINMLLNCLIEKSYIRKLALVKASLTD